MAADEASVRVERVTGPSGHPLALVTIDRAPVNAFDSVTKERLIAVAHELSRPGDVRAVVLTGRRIFSAGDDIVEMAAADRAYAARGLERISDAVSAVAAIPVPVVAAVQGAALGGGCELALAADFRVAAHDSTWGLPEVHLGLIPAGGGTQRLPRLVGTARAKRMIYLGESVSGDVALDWGLVDEAVAPDDVVDRALALADELSTRAPVALRAAKRAVDTGTAGDLDTGLRLETALFASVFATDDAATGLSSFLASGSRQARFEGR